MPPELQSNVLAVKGYYLTFGKVLEFSIPNFKQTEITASVTCS